MAATAFVIKSWLAANQPDADGNYVNITGRAGGLIAWLLNLLGISPTVSLIVRGDRIIFRKGSLREGSLSFTTPLENTCSMLYAFRRPFIEAVVLGVVLGILTFFSFGIIGIAIAVLYYALNKTLSVGFTDVGGRLHEVPFKRSVIEGQVIDEAEAARVCNIIQRLVDARREQVFVTSQQQLLEISK
jgi:hypothetical protein